MSSVHVDDLDRIELDDGFVCLVDVMGDDRIPSAGSDSRSSTIGTIPRNYIVGKAVLVFWPLSAFHFISSYDEIFSKVPNP